MSMVNGMEATVIALPGVFIATQEHDILPPDDEKQKIIIDDFKNNFNLSYSRAGGNRDHQRGDHPGKQ